MRSFIILTLVLAMTVLSACSSTPKRTRAPEVKQDPAEVNTQLGIEYMREGRYELAQEKLKKALKQNPNYQTAHTSIAVLYEKLGENKLADKHYRRAYNIDRKNAQTANNYGQFLCRSGRYKEADKKFMTAVQDPLYQYPAMVYTNAGICARKQPDIELSDKYFRTALKIDPKYRPALREMIRSSFSQQKYLATRAYLQRLQEVEPLTPEFLWIGVRAESELDDRSAMASYSLLLKNRYPASEETDELLKWERKLGER